MRDYYEPKLLLGVIRKTPGLKTFFKSRFFNNSVTFATKTVSFEFQEGKRRLAPYVNERIGSESIERDDYSLKTYEAPFISPKRVITNDTLAQKLPGEPEWNSGVTPDERAAKIAARDIMDLQDAITRREEYMCARVKQDGKLIIWDSYTTNKVGAAPAAAGAALQRPAGSHPGHYPLPPGPRHPAALLLGHDLCLRALRELRGLRGTGQHLLHLQPQDP